MILQDLVRDPGALWDREPPASPETLAVLAAALPALPADYLAFLALSGGGTGDLGVYPGYFSLWPASEVASLHAAYEVPAYLPGYTGFGSNGGGELLAFAPDGRVVLVPFVPMDAADAIDVAPTFTDLVRAFGRGVPAT
jgi:hypothetical protein